MVAKWSSYAAPTASGLSWLTLPNLPLAPLAEDEDEDEGEGDDENDEDDAENVEDEGEDDFLLKGLP